MDDILADKDAIIVCRRILTRLSEDILIQERNVRISTSIGIAFYPEHGNDKDSLVKNADLALYKAKEKGKNRYQVFHSQYRESANQRLLIESKLRQAVENNELQLFYQPFFDLKSQSITGMEALARWQCQDLGSISPSQFIPIAEDSDIIIHIGKWALRQAIMGTKQMHDQGFDHLTISVNVSAKQFTHISFLPIVSDILDDTNFPADKLYLEVTESIMMQDMKKSINVMEKLRDMDIRLAIDDFGTGHSSLNYLSKFPISKLKIDRSFVADIPYKRDNTTIPRLSKPQYL